MSAKIRQRFATKSNGKSSDMASGFIYAVSRVCKLNSNNVYRRLNKEVAKGFVQLVKSLVHNPTENK